MSAVKLSEDWLLSLLSTRVQLNCLKIDYLVCYQHECSLIVWRLNLIRIHSFRNMYIYITFFPLLFMFTSTLQPATKHWCPKNILKVIHVDIFFFLIFFFTMIDWVMEMIIYPFSTQWLVCKLQHITWVKSYIRIPPWAPSSKQNPPPPNHSGLIMSSDMLHHLTYMPTRHVTYP